MRRPIRRFALKHLNRSGEWPSGNPRWYYRPKGQRAIALPDFPMDDPRFLAAYATAAGETPRAPVIAGSIAAAIEDYKRSDKFRHGLRAGTQAVRRRALDAIARAYGSGRVADLRARHIKADLDKLGGHAANNRLKCWRGLCAFMVEEYNLPDDPSDGVKRKPVAKSDGHVPWDDDDLTAFRAHWPFGTVERLAFELIYWTGARVSDAVRLGPGNITRDGWLHFVQSKTGGEVFVPFARDLPEFAECYAADLAALHQAISTREERHMVWMATRAGAARSGKAVSQWFATKARAAGIVGKTAHGLRKTRAITLVEAGGTHHQVGAWTGHETLKEIERYARKRDRRKVLSRTPGERKSSNFSDKVPTMVKK